MSARRAGRPFFKMSGSGNDFVVFDALVDPAGELASPGLIRAVCARATGVGADGVVFLEPSTEAAFRMRYFNSDGSLASLCGNAALCVTRLAVELGVAAAAGMRFETDAGRIEARMRDGLPEVDLQPVEEVIEDFSAPGRQEGEMRLGYALAGVPHLVVLCRDVAVVDVISRGRELRHFPALREGANVNFVSRRDGRWAVRTYERGVEGETLACGTGAVATAILLTLWGTGGELVRLMTRSDKELGVRLRAADGRWVPSLSGEGRIVFRGELGEL